MNGLFWAQSDQGQVYTSETLSKIVRLAARRKQRFEQFARVDLALGYHAGDTYSFIKAGALRHLGQAIGETDEVPETDFSSRKAYVTIQEITNSIPYTERLTMHTKLSIEDVAVSNLMYNMSLTLDHFAAAPLKACDLVYVPTTTADELDYAFSTNGTAAAVADRMITAWDVRNIVDMMRADFNMPAYRNQDYVCIATSNFLRGLKEDNDFVEIAKYGDPSRLLAGEVGRYYNVRFIEENSTLSNNLPGGGGQAIFLAFDALIKVVCRPEEIQASLGKEWGRAKALRWVFIGAYTCPWDYAVDGEARCIRVDSLAA
jgi:N4-gp56 family major capsid protein